MPEDFYVRLAKNLCAASIAAELGLKSIDYTKKMYVDTKDTPIGEMWMMFAHMIHPQALNTLSPNQDSLETIIP